jgi:hypothetical protein
MPWVSVDTRVDTSTGVSITVCLYDLTQLNQAFFDRVRARVLAAADAGLTTSVMMLSAGHLTIGFSGFSNPFLEANNVNSISCDVNSNGNCEELMTLESGANGANIRAFQDAFIRKLVETLNDIDPLIWEIANEGQNGSTYGTTNSLAWQNHVADVITAYEATGGRQVHPVWMSPYPETSSANMFANKHAQITSPYCEGSSPPVNWDTNPTANANNKQINVWFLDSDHSGGFGQCGSEVSGWPWKSFTRGLYAISLGERETAPVAAQLKVEMAQTLRYANKMHLAGMVPVTDSSIIATGYGLYEACSEYLMFQPSAATNAIDLTSCEGQSFSVEYLDPATGAITTDTNVISGGASHNFIASTMRVVYLKLSNS